nr:Gag-Pol polyprotein [Tanacetum cinerariifolium]
KILSQLNQLKAKPEDEDINLKFLRALPSSLAQVALTLKTKGGLELLSFDDLYYKLKNFEIDVKGYTTFSSSQSAGPSHSAFVSTTSASKNMSYKDSPSYSLTTTYTTPSNFKTGSHRSGNKAGRKINFDKKESARFNKKKIKEIRKKEEDSKALITVYTLVDWTDHDGKSDGVIASKEFGMIACCDTEDAIEEGAAKTYNLITGADTEDASTVADAGEFARMSVTSERTTQMTLPLVIPVSNLQSPSQMILPPVHQLPVVGPVHSRNKVNHQNQFVSQAVLLRTGKVNIPPGRPQPVPTGKPKVFAPVPTGIDGQLLLSTRQVILRNHIEKENPFPDAEDEWVFDSGCSRSMTGNKERRDDFREIQGRKVTFGGGEDTECLVLSKDFKLPDDSMVVLRIPMKHNIYTINLNNLCPRGNLACLVAHASIDESVKWHRRMSYVNYKNMNRLLKGNLVRGLPPKHFKNDHTCVACCKEHKDETYPILKDFINLVENQVNKKVLNRVLVTSPHNKTPYVLLTGNIPSVSHFKPFGCHVTILNISDHLGKFDGKADEGYIVGYSASNKSYRVYNVPNKREEETMNLRFFAEKPNVQGLGHEWYFDLDYLTDTLGYKHVQANHSTETKKATPNPADTSGDAVDDSPLNSANEIFQKELARLKGQEQSGTSDVESLGLGFANDAEELQKIASANTVPPGSILVPTGSISVPSGDTIVSTDDVPVHTVEPRSVAQALEDPSWVDAMQEEMQQFKFQHVWVLVDLPKGKYAIGTKWILKNKRDARGILVRNKARLVAQGHRQEDGIDYDEVFSLDFKLPDDSMVVLRIPMKHNIYTINLNNLCLRGNLACLVAHASIDESVKWHRRMS